MRRAGWRTPVLATLALALGILPGMAQAALDASPAANTSPLAVPFDDEEECLQPVPAAASAAGITDDGGDVSIEVLVLLDGVPLDRGMAIMGQANDAYEPLGISLSPQFQPVLFAADSVDEGTPTVESDHLLAQTKAFTGGARPAGTDVVYTITAKEISDAAGFADCIGGVRYARRAFAVGENFNGEDMSVGPVNLYVRVSAKIAAHEIGHLLGAHHHYANCVEGTYTELSDVEPSTCTLMFNFLDFVSMNFSAVNAPIVRGHAVDFASP